MTLPSPWTIQCSWAVMKILWKGMMSSGVELAQQTNA